MIPNAYTEFTKEDADGSCSFKFYRSYAPNTKLETADSEKQEDQGVQRAQVSNLAVYRAGSVCS